MVDHMTRETTSQFTRPDIRLGYGCQKGSERPDQKVGNETDLQNNSSTMLLVCLFVCLFVCLLTQAKFFLQLIS